MEHAGKCQALEMVDLGENLRADQDIGVGGAFEQSFEPVRAAGGVAVHSQDPCVREFFPEQQLDPLRPAPECLQIGITALRTGAWNAFGQSAMVAAQPLRCQVHDHVRRTTPAALDPAAGGACERRRIAAAIEENERVLPARKARRERLEKGCNDSLMGRVHPRVDKAYRRQCRTVDGTSREGYQLVFTRGRVMEAFQGGSGRAQNDRCAGDVAPRNCEVACRIAHALTLLERGILLFIDHDQPQTRERRKYREPRAEHDISATAVGEEPSADALQFSHGARLRDDARARESVAERGLEGGSESYLGYENQDLFAPGEDFRGQLEIDLCLTAAGDSKEEAHPEFLQSAAQNADRLPLLGGQLVRMDETGLGPLRLDRSDPTRFNA